MKLISPVAATRNTETIEPWAQEVIDRFRTYTETPPSQTGVRLLFTFARAVLPAVEALFGGKYVRTFKRDNGSDHPPAIEIHRGHRCFAVTGDTISETDALRLVDVAVLERLICDHGPKFAGPGASASEASPQGDDGRSGKAFRIGLILIGHWQTRRGIRCGNALLTYANPEISDWAHTKGMANGEHELRRIYDKARRRNPGVRLQHFVAFMQSKGYIYLPAGDFWPAERVNARLPPLPQIDSEGQPVLNEKTGEQETIQQQPGAWPGCTPVEQITWARGAGRNSILDRLISDGGLDRAPRRRDRTQPLSAAQGLCNSERDQGRAMDRTCEADLGRARRGRTTISSCGLATACSDRTGEGQPRTFSHIQPSGHRQRHHAGAGLARRWRRGISWKRRRSKSSAASTAFSRASCSGSPRLPTWAISDRPNSMPAAEDHPRCAAGRVCASTRRTCASTKVPTSAAPST